jgi:hypothetical protein
VKIVIIIITLKNNKYQKERDEDYGRQGEETRKCKKNKG